jgi:autoinducer 2-degrading protein
LEAKASGDRPFAVIVQAEIEPDRMGVFLELIETNAKETRKEPGCIRFDVLRSQDADNMFFFYELYRNADAIDHHKKQPHYNLWADFKGSGGVISSTSHKTDGEFLT